MRCFLIFLAMLGGFVIITTPAFAMCAFDPDNPFAPCEDTIGTLEYPKTPDEIVPAPLKQMNLGIKLGHIICDPDKYPVWNVHYKPACVYPDSEGELLTRGWAKLRLLLPAGPDPITELEVMGQNVFSLRILGNYVVGDEKYPLSEDRKRELAWEYSRQYYSDQTFLEYAITPHQNYYNVGDKIQLDLLEWGNYSGCWNLDLKIIDVKNNPVYEDNSVKHCLEPDEAPGTFNSYSIGKDFEAFACEKPGYYRIEVSNAKIFSADILENFVCIQHKPEPEPIPEPEPTSTDHQNLIDAKNKIREIYRANSSLGPFNVKDAVVGFGIGDGFLIVDILEEYFNSDEDRKLVEQKIIDITGGKLDIEFNSSDAIVPTKIESVFPYVWNSFLHGNGIEFAPKEQSYANNDEGYEEQNRVCSPIVAPNGTDFYVSSIFTREPFEITGTFIDKTMPDDCHKVWKTDTILEEPDRILMLWLENYQTSLENEN